MSEVGIRRRVFAQGRIPSALLGTVLSLPKGRGAGGEGEARTAEPLNREPLNIRVAAYKLQTTRDDLHAFRAFVGSRRGCHLRSESSGG